MSKNINILVVDDTEINVEILEAFLEEYHILTAYNGKEALKIVEDNDIDIILLDIMMPEMDGYEVCEILKSQPHTKDIPILFITAKTDDDSIDKAFDIGGIDYITKPFINDEILDSVKLQVKSVKIIKNLEAMSSR